MYHFFFYWPFLNLNLFSYTVIITRCSSLIFILIDAFIMLLFSVCSIFILFSHCTVGTPFFLYTFTSSSNMPRYVFRFRPLPMSFPAISVHTLFPFSSFICTFLSIHFSQILYSMIPLRVQCTSDFQVMYDKYFPPTFFLLPTFPFKQTFCSKFFFIIYQSLHVLKLAIAQ